MYRGIRIAAPASLLLSLALLGCNPAGGSASGGLNIGLNNQSGRRLNVTLVIDGQAQPGISINHGAFVTDEFTGAVGAVVVITAAANDGAPALNLGPKTCIAKATIVNTSEYGQIDFGAGGINCTDPGTWQ